MMQARVSSNPILVVVLLVSFLVLVLVLQLVVVPEYFVTSFTISPVRLSSPSISLSSMSWTNHRQKHQRHYPILQSTTTTTTTTTTDTTIVNNEDTVTNVMNIGTTTTIPLHLSKRKLDEILCTFNSSALNEVLLNINQLRKQQQQQQSDNNNITVLVLEKYLNNILLVNGQDDDDFDSMTISNMEQHVVNSGSTSKLPFWSNIRLLTRFSKRARLASFYRTIDLLTPPPPEQEQEELDGSSAINKNKQQLDDKDILRRKRRALVQLLQSLATTTTEVDNDSTKLSTSSNEKGKRRFHLPAITVLEKRATESLKVTNFDELIRRRPTGLETPDYTIVVPANNKNKIGYEIRQYNPYSVCTVSMNKPRPNNNEITDAKISEPKLSGASSFGALAGYLFGKNQQGIAMKMTTPVLTTTSTTSASTDTNNNKEMSFILPSTYWNSNGTTIAPQPIIGSGVTLHYTPEQYKAVLMFGGYATTTEIIKNKQKLVSSLLQSTNWEPIININSSLSSSMSSNSDDDETTTNNNYNKIYDSVILAQYNDPFTPPWKRLNEVSITVQPKS